MKKLYTTILLLPLLLCGSIASRGQVSLTAINSPYTQNFNTLASSGLTNDIGTLPGGWTFLETGTNANTTYAAGTGSSNAGNTYSFGLDASDRALGGLLSGSLIPALGAGFVNQTGTTITSLQLSYKGEQWRLGATGRGADRLDFQYSLDATSLNSGTWTDVNDLDFSSPVVTGTAGALNGNDSLNSTTITFSITGLTLENGAVFYLRWQDFNVTSSDDGLAIDDFILTPIGLPPTEPAISFSPAQLNFGDVTVNTSDTLVYSVSGANLEDSIIASTLIPAFTISTDGNTFSTSVTLPDSGGLVYVRFAPVANEAYSDTIFHTSGEVLAGFVIRGNGFDQASNIIPIATARTRPLGETVTVAGRITVGNELGNPAYIQDSTGGIPVFNLALANAVTLGDSVIVTGPVGVFNDQIQISGSGIFFTIADTTKRFVTPKQITIDELAANEGLLVTVQDVELVNKNFVFYPQSTEQMTAGGIQADLRIDGNTNIPGLTKPQGISDITGVVGRFRTNAQLLPRFQADIPGAAEPSTPHDSIPRNKTLDVVTWNLEFFGARKEDYRNEEYGPENEALQLQNVKQVLDSLNADIIAVEEVSDDSLFAVLVSQLSKYAYTCSDRYSYSFNGPSDTFPPQKVCFIYDTTTIEVLAARPLFENLYDSARTTAPSLLPGYPSGDPSSFYSSGRLPYLITVNSTIEGVTEKISLIVIHGKSGDEAADRNRREYDAAVLKDSLDAHFPDEQFIILGDLNDDLDQSITAGAVSPYAPFVSDTARYAAITKALSDADARSTTSYNDVIDHQIISNELKEEYLQGSAQILTPFRLIPDYANTTSDHLPVITRYALRAPVISFVQAEDTLTEDSSTHTVKLVLREPLSENKQITILVNGSTTYGEDYFTEPAVAGNALILNIPAGATTAYFTLNVVNDIIDELAETTYFTIQPSVGLSVGDQSTFTLTLEDNDVPQISFAGLFASAEEGSGPYQIKLKLSVPPASDQSITLQVYQGPGVDYNNDYITEPAINQHTIQLPIPAGSTEAYFTVTPNTDIKREFPEIISFYMAQVSSGLQINSPRISVFAIIDVRKTQPYFTVSPNPTTGVIKLRCEGLDAEETVQVELRNGDGALLYNSSGTLKTLSEGMSQTLLQSKRGIYTIKVYKDGEIQLVRLVKI